MAARTRLASFAAVLFLLGGVVPARAQEIREPATGVTFAARDDGMSLLGIGLRTRTFLKVKVYAIGLYVADEALSGPLLAFKGRTDESAFYQALVDGDFRKAVRLKFVRDVSADQIQDAMRDALAGADPARVATFVSYFPAIRSGQECLIRVLPGGTVETTMAGVPRPPLADPPFARALFAVWLGETPIQNDVKRGLVSRAAELIR